MKSHDDDAADVAQTHLARDLRRRFDVRLDDRVFEIAAAGELAGVDVDDGQRFGRLDDDRTARRQIDLRLHQLLQLFVDLVVVEERARRSCSARCARRTAARAAAGNREPCVLFLVVDQDVLDVGGDEVARRFVDEVHVLVQQRRRRRALVRSRECRATCGSARRGRRSARRRSRRRRPCARRSPCLRAESASSRS